MVVTHTTIKLHKIPIKGLEIATDKPTVFVEEDGETYLYSPRDIWEKPYFIEINGKIVYNKNCSLNESNYMQLIRWYKLKPRKTRPRQMKP